VQDSRASPNMTVDLGSGRNCFAPLLRYLERDRNRNCSKRGIIRRSLN